MEKKKRCVYVRTIAVVRREEEERKREIKCTVRGLIIMLLYYVLASTSVAIAASSCSQLANLAPHPNVLVLRAACLVPGFLTLINQYQPEGSLASMLRFFPGGKAVSGHSGNYAGIW